MTTFSPVGSSQIQLAASTSNPTILNATIVAGVELAVVIPNGTKRLQLKLRDSSPLELAVVSGGPIYTIPKNCFYAESELGAMNLTYYLKTTQNSTVEILLWT